MSATFQNSRAKEITRHYGGARPGLRLVVFGTQNQLVELRPLLDGLESLKKMKGRLEIWRHEDRAAALQEPLNETETSFSLPEHVDALSAYWRILASINSYGMLSDGAKPRSHPQRLKLERKAAASLTQKPVYEDAAQPKRS